MYRYPDAIVETGWLADNLDDPNLRIFDCTTHLRDATEPGQPYRVESGRADYDLGHIPGAGFLALQGELSESGSKFRSMAPSAEQFAAAMSAHGVGDDSRVVPPTAPPRPNGRRGSGGCCAPSASTMPRS